MKIQCFSIIEKHAFFAFSVMKTFFPDEVIFICLSEGTSFFMIYKHTNVLPIIWSIYGPKHKATLLANYK